MYELPYIVHGPSTAAELSHSTLEFSKLKLAIWIELLVNCMHMVNQSGPLLNMEMDTA